MTSLFLSSVPDGSAGAPVAQTGTARKLATIPRQLIDRLRRVSAEWWWLLLFIGLFLGFFVALLFQPTIGRGGR